MGREETTEIITIRKKLPERLMDAISELALAYSEKGVQLFIFGSFATQTDEKTSDLDLGVLWETEPSKRLFIELYESVLQLPTIRKIDLVDMSIVDEKFRENALKNAVFLIK